MSPKPRWSKRHFQIQLGMNSGSSFCLTARISDPQLFVWWGFLGTATITTDKKHTVTGNNRCKHDCEWFMSLLYMWLCCHTEGFRTVMINWWPARKIRPRELSNRAVDWIPKLRKYSVVTKKTTKTWLSISNHHHLWLFLKSFFYFIVFESAPNVSVQINSDPPTNIVGDP